MKIVVHRELNSPGRDGAEGFCLGRMWVDGIYFAYTCEDEDRYLETGGEKVMHRTAIPRGTYSVGITFSNRFQKPMIQLFNVPGFEGIRVHAGNRSADSSGCILIGQARTIDGVAQCSAKVTELFNRVQACEDAGEPCTLTVE